MKKLFLLIILAYFANPEPAWPQGSSPFALRAMPSPSNEPGIPFITNWSPKEYGQHKQNWAIVQDGRGVMYFGNGNGVLEYDGITWRLISLPNQSWALSLAIDRDGRIYVGGETEIGYLLPDATGEMQYVSLMTYVPKQYRDFADVWQTLATRDGIYFSSRKYLFRWRSNPTADAQGDLHVWKPEHSFHVAFLLEDTLYVRQRETGLMKLIGDSLRLVPGGEKFANDGIHVMLPFDRDRVLVGARTQGLFLYDGETFQPFNTQADAFLRENQLYHGTVLADGTFALATLRDGLVIIDKQGRVRQMVSKTSGLRNETVWFLYPDREGALWLALNSGLARVETPAPLSLFSEPLGINGSVEAILRHRGRLYAATNQGVYFLSSSASTGTFPIFQPVSGIAVESWSLLSVNNTMLAATGDGVFRIEGDRATQWVSDSPSYFLYHSRRDSIQVYVGLNDGLALLQWKNGNWHFAGRIPGISGEVRSIVEDEEGVLWLGCSQQGVLRVTVPPSGLAIDKEAPEIEIERYTEKDGIPRGWAEVSFVKKQARFATNKGLRRFDRRSRSFLPDSTFGKTFADTAHGIVQAIEDRHGRVLIRTSDQNKTMVGVAAPQEDGTYSWNAGPFVRISEYGNVLSIYPDPGHPGVLWLGGDGSIVRYDPAVAKDYSVDYSALIRRVTVNLNGSGRDSVIFGGTSEYAGEQLQRFPTLRHANNALRFEFAATSYDGRSANQYQIFLEGFDKNWSAWTAESKKDYTNLAEGDYHFRVRAKNLYDHLSQEAVYSFKILPPWWRTWWAYGGYAVMLGLLVFVADRVQRRRLLKKERERAEIRETKLRAQAVEAENKALQAENARKEVELQKAAELKAAYQELDAAHTNLKATQQQLVTQQKLASLGQLTAGIAHEIKNPLNFVNNFAALSVDLAKELREELERRRAKGDGRGAESEERGAKSEDEFANIEEILEALIQNAEKINHHGKRADGIVKSMMQHARGSSGQHELADINHLLDEAVNLTYHGMRANDASFNITIEKDYDESIGKLEVVPQDLSRVFLNIVNNAAYAANQKKKDNFDGFSPMLSVATKNLGDKIEIRIRDNGNGIPVDIREKIFTPFFTTKPTGQGTGLGLSISHDIIVQQHRGEIKVETEEGKFTEFVVRLPKNG